MPRVRFIDREVEVEWPTERSLLQCILELGIEISHICGGDGACGTCRIEVVEGWNNLTPQTPDELSREVATPHRLSCQARVVGDVAVRIARIE